MSKTEKCTEFCLSATDTVWTKGMFLPAPKLFLLFFLMFNCFCGSSLWVGWPSIIRVYQSEGIYSSLCEQNNAILNLTLPSSNSTFISCTAQDDRFNIIYTVTSSCYYFGYLFFGFMVDLAGPKVTNMVSNLFIFVGSTLLIFYKGKITFTKFRI